MPPEVREALRAKFGLDDPVWARYLHWISAMLQGDWGFSFISRVDVDQLIKGLTVYVEEQIDRVPEGSRKAPQQTIVKIEPANPQVVYVPTYNPTVVYGPWPYPSYPPYYWPTPGYAFGSALMIDAHPAHVCASPQAPKPFRPACSRRRSAGTGPAISGSGRRIRCRRRSSWRAVAS